MNIVCTQRLDAQETARAGLGARLPLVHAQLRRLPGFSPLTRLAVALYREASDSLVNIAVSDDGVGSLDRYEMTLSDVPSLAVLATGDQPRIVGDLRQYGRQTSLHTAELLAYGVRSSFTCPIRDGETFLGFTFFNAREPDFFTPPVVGLLAPFAGDIMGMVVRQARAA